MFAVAAQVLVMADFTTTVTNLETAIGAPVKILMVIALIITGAMMGFGVGRGKEMFMGCLFGAFVVFAAQPIINLLAGS